MLDYDLKLQFTVKTKTAKLECSISLALAPSSGKVSEKQAFGESHAGGRCNLEMHVCDNLKKAHVCTRRGVKRGSSLKPRTMPVKGDRSVRATPLAPRTFLQGGGQARPSVRPRGAFTGAFLSVNGHSRPQPVADPPRARVWQTASGCRAEASGATSLCTAGLLLLGSRSKKAEL